MPFKDRTNIKYGKLTAIEYLGKSMWKCQCDCGNEKIVSGGHLETGHTKSCGCYRPPRIDLTNQKFGRLIALEYNGNSKWKCRCDCGNELLVETGNLRTGNTKSCGCYQRDRAHEANFQDLSGQIFGKLTVIKRVENNRFDQVCYQCQCECGGTTIVPAQNLRKGITNSCGCIKSKGEMLINKWLVKHQINFHPQYSTEKIVLDSGRHPFFDFAIFNNNNQLICLIEYNGRQHYGYKNYGWDNEDNFLKTQHRDKQKIEQCKKLNIPLYIIKYDENIESRLEEIFSGLDTDAEDSDV